MLSEEKMRETINTTLVNLLADAILNQILEKMQPQWDKITEELVSSRKTNATLANTLSTLEDTIAKQSRLIEQFTQDRQTIKETATKALEILNEAKTELGLE